jgi:hypothetical protein
MIFWDRLELRTRERFLLTLGAVEGGVCELGHGGETADEGLKLMEIWGQLSRVAVDGG